MENRIIVNNLLVSYLKFGEGEIAVIFLHGWKSNKEVWGSVIQLISKSLNQLINIYALDFPGFGKSEIPKHAMSVEGYANLVEQFIKKLELKNIIIVGHSFGGRVGIKLASEYPGLVSKLVLVDAAGFAMDSAKKNKMRVLAKFAKPFFKPRFMQGLRKKIYEKIGSADYLEAGDLKEIYIKTIDEDLSEDMKKITCPTLIVTGENDLDTPIEFGRRMNSLILNSEFLILKNAGHFSFLDQLGEFVKVLKKFIN